MFYIILTSAQLYAFSSQKIRNLLTYLFTISLSMHCLSYFFVGLHKIVFAHDGQGFEILNTVADIIRILSLVILHPFLQYSTLITNFDWFFMTLLKINWKNAFFLIKGTVYPLRYYNRKGMARY